MKTRTIKNLNKVNDAITYYELKYDEAPKELYEYQEKLIKSLNKKKINIIDESERQQTLEFIKGFKTGRNNAIANIVHAHDSGQSLKSIYKVIKEIYRKEVKDANINH